MLHYIQSGGPGRFPARGSHRSGRARLTHTAPLVMDSLRDEEFRTGTNIGIDHRPRHTHAPWNRLVKIEYGANTRAEYSYNGLNWRIIKRGDLTTPATGEPTQQRIMYYSPAPGYWQLIEEDIDDACNEQTSDDRWVQYIWGNFRGRYIDDILLRREDRNDNGDYSDAGDIERYYLTEEFRTGTNFEAVDGLASPTVP